MSEEQVGGLILPTNPEERQKIKMGIKEICNSKTRIQSEKDNIKSIVKDLSKEHELPKPTINKIATIYYKQNKIVEESQMEDIFSLYETIFEMDDDEVEKE